MVLLAGIAVPLTQSGGISLLPPQRQLLATDPTRSGGISWLSPKRQLLATEGLASASQGWASGAQMRTIAPLTYGNFAPPAGSPDPSMSPSDIDIGHPETWRLDPALTGLFNNTLSAGVAESGIGASGPAPTITGAVAGRIQAVCTDNQLMKRLQSGGEFWTAQTVSAVPVRLGQGEFAALERTNSLSDPIQGPGGDRSNLAAPGPPGGWCRPNSVPFTKIDPLASRAFWVPVSIVFVAVVVFLLSRGVKMPS